MKVRKVSKTQTHNNRAVIQKESLLSTLDLKESIESIKALLESISAKKSVWRDLKKIDNIILSLKGEGQNDAVKIIEGVYRGFRKEDRSKDQLPSLIYVSSTSNTLIEQLFCASTVVDEGVHKGGAFGTASRMLSVDHVESEASDFTPTAYMLNHLDHADGKNGFDMERDVAPYILIVGDYDNKVSKKESVVEVLKKRSEKLVRKFKTAGHSVEEEDGVMKLIYAGKKERVFYILPVLHHVKNAKLFVITSRGMEDFRSFVERIGISENESVKKHLASLKKYEEEGVSPNIYDLRYEYKSVRCVDSRCCGSGVVGELRVIGAVLSNNELERLIGNSQIKSIDIYFHTSCGYLNTAIKFYGLLKDSKILPKKEREELYNYLKSVFELGRVPEISEEKKARLLKYVENLPKGSRALFEMIIRGEYVKDKERRYNIHRILKHLWDRSVIVGEFSGEGIREFTVRPIDNVEKYLASSGEVDKEFFTYLVIEEFARFEKEKILEKCRELGVEEKEINLYIETLNGRGVFLVPEKFELKRERDRCAGVSETGKPVFEKVPI